MNTSQEPAADLIDQAIDWIILLHSGQAGAEDMARLAQWRASSPEHECAYRQAKRLWDDAGEAFGLDEAPRLEFCPPARPGHFNNGGGAAFGQAKRRRLRCRPSRLPAAVGMLLLALAVLFGHHHLSDPLLHDHYTRHGEQKPVILADGSEVLLNTDTALDEVFENAIRTVRLARGQAVFRVKADPARPFEVEAASATVRALGTVFEVRREGEAVAVVVQEHAVAVRSRTGAFSGEIRVKAGEKLGVDASRASLKPEPVDVGETAAWQRRKLIFDELPLGRVIDEINRYADGKILITDSALKARSVTGVFPIDDTDGALRAICSTLQLRETRLGPWLVLLHR